MRMKIVNPVTMAVFFLATFSIQHAQALSCKLNSNSLITEPVELNNLIFLSGTKNGEKVWESQVFTRDISCTSKINENVYVYPYPKRGKETLPKGVKMGLIFNGKDLGTFDLSSTPAEGKIDTNWTINKNTAHTTMSFQAYLKKEGDIDTSMVSMGVTLFQLDGVKGLNGTPDSNYNLNIRGWEKAGTLTCKKELKSTSFTLGKIDTLKAMNHATQLNNGTARIEAVCSSTSSNIVNAAKTLQGTIKLTGSSAKNDDRAFASQLDTANLLISLNGTAVTPGKEIPFTVPLSAGKGSVVLPLTYTPEIAKIPQAPGEPEWLFKESDEAAKITVDFSFNPTIVTSQ
ncbi:hypothetical protein [Erwinia sp. ErVv1]|uniref:hypothetical protein n=1 Tax=Erwinia sp. ErVv1 TaxID=1603299 RepID=UPI000B09E128|nr:hypothetical protein [Erwinia sp. ErVv1]